MTWTLFLWLAGSPGAFVPLESFPTSAACHRAKRAEVNATVMPNTTDRARRGGVTYLCLRSDQ